MTPFFSVVIATYNRPHHLQRAIKSVLEQTFLNFEIIIINDGSSLDYAAIEEYISDISVIKYFYTSNNGRSSARNLGIKKSAGSFICFLDDDDVFYNNHLFILNNYIEQNGKAKGLYHTLYNLNKDDVITSCAVPKVNPSKPIYFFEETVVIHSIAVPKEILVEYFFNENLAYYEDTELWFRIVLKYPIIRIDIVTVEYIIHNNNTINWSLKSLNEKVLSLIYLQKTYKSQLGRLFFKHKITNTYILLIQYAFSENNYIKSLKSIYNAVMSDSNVLFERYIFVMFVKNLMALFRTRIIKLGRP